MQTAREALTPLPWLCFAWLCFARVCFNGWSLSLGGLSPHLTLQGGGDCTKIPNLVEHTSSSRSQQVMNAGCSLSGQARWHLVVAPVGTVTGIRRAAFPKRQALAESGCGRPQVDLGWEDSMPASELRSCSEQVASGDSSTASAVWRLSQSVLVEAVQVRGDGWSTAERFAGRNLYRTNWQFDPFMVCKFRMELSADQTRRAGEASER
jgi:hypothetical protein